MSTRPLSASSSRRETLTPQPRRAFAARLRGVAAAPPAAEHAPAVVTSAARTWGPRFLAAVGLGVLGSAIIGVEWGLSLMIVAALGVAILARSQPAVSALAVTCVVVLDPLAADFLQSPLMGNPLPSVTGGLWRYNTVGYLLVFFAASGAPLVFRQRDVHTRIIQVFAVLLGAGLVWSPGPDIGLQILLDILSVFGLFVVLARIADDGDAWFWMGIVGGTLAVSSTLLYLLIHHRIPYTNPNVAVFTPLAGLFAVSLGFARGAPTASRQAALGLLAIVNLLWAFLSTSRGGLLTATSCLVFLGMQVPNVKRRMVLLVGTLLLAVAVTSLFTEFQQSAIQRFTLLFDSSARMQERTSGRSDLMVGAWEIFKRNPFGVGTGGFESTWATLGSVGGQRQFMRAGQKFAAHAGWMRVLAENGFLGFTVLACYVLSFALVGLSRRDRTQRNLGVLATLAIAISLVTTEFHLKGLFFLAVGVTVCLHVASRLAPVVATAPARWHRRPTLTVQPNRMEVH